MPMTEKVLTSSSAVGLGRIERVHRDARAATTCSDEIGTPSDMLIFSAKHASNGVAAIAGAVADDDADGALGLQGVLGLGHGPACRPLG